MTGLLALVGGTEWTAGCDFDSTLLKAGGADEVVVLPTAAAYEHPERVVEAATTWFAALGATVRPVMALDRRAAFDDDHVAAVRDATFIYLAGGSPMHLRSVLLRSPLWEALEAAWRAGAVLAGSAAGAMVLCDPMVDTRGGAFTVGLGLVPRMALITRVDTWTHDKLRRTLQLAPRGLPLVGVERATALLRDPYGSWQVEGVGDVTVWVDGQEAALDALPTEA